jgi:hypothetical protein
MAAMTSQEVDHCCSVTFVVVGDTLPDDILTSLELRPDRSWLKGERKSVQRPDGSTFILDSINERSGWKFFPPEKLDKAELQEQISHWLSYISKHEGQLIRVGATGAKMILDVYVSTLEAVNFKPIELHMLGRCGVELDWSIYPSSQKSRTP